MVKRYWYAEMNCFGLDLTLDSIGWNVLRFKSKQARDSYVDMHCYSQDTGNWICREIDYRRMRKHLGYVEISWHTDGSDYVYELGVRERM